MLKDMIREAVGELPIEIFEEQLDRISETATGAVIDYLYAQAQVQKSLATANSNVEQATIYWQRYAIYLELAGFLERDEFPHGRVKDTYVLPRLPEQTLPQ